MGGDYIDRKVSTKALCSLTSQSLANLTLSKTKQWWMPSGYVMIGLSLYVLIIVRFMRARSLYIFTCGLLRCSSFDSGAMRDALRSGDGATGTATHTFLYPCT